MAPGPAAPVPPEKEPGRLPFARPDRWSACLTEMVDDAHLGLEFAWTGWAESCRDWYSIVQCCRRPSGHEGNHASGFGDSRHQWLQDAPTS